MAPSIAVDPAAAIRRRCDRLAGHLRDEIPALRRDVMALEPDLPAEYLRGALLEGNYSGYPFPIWAAVDGLVGEDLCGTIAVLERIASMSPDNPTGTRRSPDEIWAEVDPEAPRGLA